jgi:hypothetical protein
VAEITGLLLMSASGVIQLRAGVSVSTQGITILSGSYLRVHKLN